MKKILAAICVILLLAVLGGVTSMNKKLEEKIDSITDTGGSNGPQTEQAPGDESGTQTEQTPGAEGGSQTEQTPGEGSEKVPEVDYSDVSIIGTWFLNGAYDQEKLAKFDAESGTKLMFVSSFYPEVGFYELKTASVDDALYLCGIDEDGVEHIISEDSFELYLYVYSEVADENVKAWLIENAEKTSDELVDENFPSEECRFYIDGVEYKLIQGMAWEDWCESDYNPILEDGSTKSFFVENDFLKSHDGGYMEIPLGSAPYPGKEFHLTYDSGEAAE